MFKSKKSSEMALQFLIGLIFTGFLIFFTFKLVTHFFSFDPKYERDLVDGWVKEINDLEEKRFTQLLLVNNNNTYNNFIWVFSSNLNDRIYVKSDSFDNNEFFKEYIIPSGQIEIIPKCKNRACICAININSGKTTYCKDFKDIEIINYNVKQISITKEGIIGRPVTKVIQGADSSTDINSVFFVSKYSILKYAETSQILYAKKVDKKTIKLCNSRELCES